jgi:hypothetical protein
MKHPVSLLTTLLLLTLCSNKATAQGVLTNGWTYDGTIAPAGHSDTWTFSATSGDSIVVRVGEITSTNGFTPRIRLFNPSAGQQALASGSVAAEIAVTATNTGTFTVIVDDAIGTTATGTYRLTLAKSGSPVAVAPGDEGGPMINGVTYQGDLPVGDLDVWSFNAVAGEGIVVRMGATNTAYLASNIGSWVRLFAPNGALVGEAFNANYGSSSDVQAQATNSGQFTVVVGTYGNNLAGTGGYRVTLAKTGDPVLAAPGDEGGPMTGAGVYSGAIDGGDLDVWSFTACAGESIFLQMDEVTVSGPLTPYLRLYGRDGTLLNTVSGASTAQISRGAPTSGNYLLVAGDFSGNLAGTGAYTLTVNGLSDGFKTCMAVISGTNANLGGIGGPPGTNVVLYTTTNVATAAALWTPILTNQFDQFGVIEYTNLFNLAERQRFFRLRHP